MFLIRSPIKHLFQKSPTKGSSTASTTTMSINDELHPFSDDDDDDATTIISLTDHGNILPSYYMYKTFLHHKLDEVLPPPPVYESTDSLTNSEEEELNDISSCITSDFTCVSKSLQGMSGETSINTQIILNHPDNYDYHQDDVLSGTLVLTNPNEYDVSFSMIYILFEGYTRSCTFEEKVFLSMVDYDAFTKDGAVIHGSGGKFKQPFHFTIPPYLLDSQCSKIIDHLLIPPTMKNLVYGTSKIGYRLSCHVIDYDADECKNRKLGTCHKEINVIPRTIPHSPSHLTYDFVLDKFYDELLFINKTKFETLFEQLKLKPLTSKTTFPMKDKQVVIYVQADQIDIPYTPIIELPDRLRHIVDIPINIENSTIKSVHAEMLIVTGSSFSPIPIHISQNMLYDSFSSDKYETLVKIPLRKLISSFRKYSIEINTSKLEKLLKTYVQYTPLTIPDVTITPTGVSLDIGSMYIKNLDKAKVSNRYGNGFNLVPNFQNCYNFREYHLKLKIQFAGKSKKHVVNIPVKVAV